MRKLSFSLALLGLVAVPAAAQSIGGTYTVAGTNFDGSSYGGEPTITLTSETTCTIHWETGGSSSDGICMRNDDAFSAGYVMGKASALSSIRYRTTARCMACGRLPARKAVAPKC
nr:hypothetical protein [Mesorhizobium sp.]